MILTDGPLGLREWTDADLPVMSRLFDDPAVAYRTPLATPFDEAAAAAYLAMIRRTRAEGTRLHLAITEDGGAPLGEVLLSLSDGALGYAVGAAHRGRGLAARATRLLTGHAHGALGLSRVVLRIEPDNAASVAVARAAGFRLTGEPPATVRSNGRAHTLLTWAHHAPAVTP
ncbi:N-acetyltransferase [Streptomyces sp. WAC05374]|uniref:GNAT family N-acetyltransferase n=1 Tax=Streptomyces sp. WAC05374 TaxID=2487420 RepID=UPI000F89BAA6|nr:GNAT family N-acetyltransferase [Streptomyces sp. WAC05374]RST18447.1 N-acetyltransferase [Streptomyces sp. WAC05374]TDF42987.1 N-acetyltransferase [Streptomyces sp. WAC05374]TDF46702.1 N-acetyltransferase [Streptomyces sp. WAC05374]TDF48896.1 N-acetyltransferase [Streptomyces sp. WAC05374]